MIGIDLNHKVKAYNDFNLLLLCIAKTRQEYIALSQPTEDIESRIITIKDKMTGSLPERTHRYYKKQLANFASVYLTQKHTWRCDSIGFGKCRYHEDDVQFSRLQVYAKSGNIIYVIGDINNLQFLGEVGESVSVVDASNIHDYSILNFKFRHNIAPRIIITLSQYQKTEYHSFIFDLDNEESYELDRLLAVIKSSIENFSFSWVKCKLGGYDLSYSTDLFNIKDNGSICKRILKNM